MVEWITETMTRLGYFGIGFLMFLENLFPPIPSELIMPLAGFTASKGDLQIIPSIIAGVVGTILGAFPWYYIGRFISEPRLEAWVDRYGKWLGFSGKDIKKSQHWFDKHGKAVVFFGRLIPGVRTLISLPAGIDAMPMPTFLIYSTAGTTIWVTALTLAGYFLGEKYTLVEEYVGPLSKVVLGLLVLAFIIWVGLRLANRKNRLS
jgi:membrane protein DedA with SNARE-associated domain